uniref:Uncharacterized protein n=1 Tax=Brugia timori TaxID=42155 RepID=A0A0R3QHP7_9BILA
LNKTNYFEILKLFINHSSNSNLVYNFFYHFQFIFDNSYVTIALFFNLKSIIIDDK